MRVRCGAHQDLKRETPVIAQQGLDGVEVEHELREAAGSVLLGQMRIPWAGKGGSTCGSVASALSSGAFSVVRTRPAGKANKVVSRQARPGASGTAHLACSSGAPTRRDPGVGVAIAGGTCTRLIRGRATTGGSERTLPH